MDDAKYTRGPWRFDPCGKTLFGSDHGITHTYLNKPGQTCAELGHCPTECGPFVFAFDGKKSEDSIPSASDRALIEAAPDLLEALAGVLLVADRATDEFDAARRAIVKATGGAA